MSVQQISVEVLNAFGARLVTIGHRTTCDEWYSYSCGDKLSNGDVWGNATHITKMVADMNALNYSKRYKEECESLSDFVNIQHTNISVYQFLKTLGYIIYNTFDYEEYFNEEQKEIAKVLRNLQFDMMQNIINKIPQYENAKWSTI